MSFARRWGALALATGASLVSARARAQQAPPADTSAPAPAPPALTPPVLTKDEGAQYPAELLARAPRETLAVGLVLVVGVDGRVTRVDVEKSSGVAELDRAAVDAAKKLEFRPATRNGQPVAARVRHAYEFAPPLSRIVGSVQGGIQTRRPIAGAAVTLRAPDGAERTAVTGADGAFRFDELKPGKYHVIVNTPGRRPLEDDEDVEPGTERALVFNPPELEAPKAPGEEAVEEITVKGERPPREVTKRTLEQREMERIPGTNGDALRSLQNLPGVARPPTLLGLLIVRGSAPQDTNVFVDGTLVPLVYHFGGLSSVVPTEILEKIDFYPGNFSAQYGRGMGGIVDVGVRDPKKELHGLAQVDLIDARVLAEGPLWGTGWNFAVAGRRSYVDVWLKPVLERTGANVSTAPVYYDYQAILERDFSKTSNFRVFVFGSDDSLSVLTKGANGSDPSFTGGLNAHTGFWRTQARYRNKFDDATELKMQAAFGQDIVDFQVGDNYFRLTSWPISSRVELSEKLAKGLVANVGMDMYYAPYTVDVRFPPFPRPGEPPPGPFVSRPPLTTSDTDAIYRPGLYTELEMVPWSGGRIVPGVRVDYAKDTRAWDLSPRVVARQDITGPSVGAAGDRRTTLKGGVGVFAQPPQPQETNPVFGTPGLVSERALHYDLGVEREFTRNIELSFEGFYKQMEQLVVTKLGNVGTGRAYGLEMLLRYKPDERFFGWLAYTLSRSERQDGPDQPVRVSQFDQTHILTVLGSYKLGRGWELGARFRLVSGSMYTPQSYGFYDENAGGYVPLSSYPPNNARLPAFHQLDVRVDKMWKFRHWSLSAYLDVQNVYNQGNVEGVSYNYNSTRQTYATGLPILPVLGLRGEL